MFRIALLLGGSLALLLPTIPSPCAAQDWGSETDESDESWSDGATIQEDDRGSTGWSFRAGIGFIDDPTAFLLNFEVPYAFDRRVSVGPMIQVGLDDDNTIVAPTLNLTVTIPDLPGENWDRVKPFGLIGIGFAYIEDDNRRNDDSSAGFLVNFGFGLEFQLSESLFVGSQMMFNFLPETTLGQNFFYSWQIGGLRLAF
jgi:hypothetical protein